MARHRADAAHPAPTVWGMPRNRQALPVKHRAEHRHTFVEVARFDGLRAGINQCLTLIDGQICGVTQTVWHAPIEAAS